MEFIAPADVSTLPSTAVTEVRYPCFNHSVCSFFPPYHSLSGSSVSNETLPDLWPSIQSFFPPYNSHYGSSVSNETLPDSWPSIQSFFPPYDSLSGSSLSTESKLPIPDLSPSMQSFFPPYYSLSGSSLSSESTLPVPDLSPSIPSVFPPNNSLPRSVSRAETKYLSPSITSFFPPTQSQPSSVSSEGQEPHGFAHSIPSIVQPIIMSPAITRDTMHKYSYSPSIESTQTDHEHHFQRWCTIKFNDDQKIFTQQVEAEFEKARERWTYAIYWELDGPSYSFLSATLSPAKGFYNVEDHRFKDKAISFFQLRDSWSNTFTSNSVICHVFHNSWPIWLVGEDYLAGSLYYRARQGHESGLQTMSWIRLAYGVMEFGPTKLIHRA